MIKTYLALGSNLGDRLLMLLAALTRLESPELKLCRVSRVRETEPVGLREQPRFLNQVAEFETSLSPVALLERAQRVEREMGRIRTVLNGPRTIDIDILLYGDQVVQDPGLELPHPRFRDRRFVLEPLAELNPGLNDPVTGKPVSELLSGLDAGSSQEPPGRLWETSSSLT
ncbi:MAG TPA: 2-amino-4-hydroxy-6-hydroxymethyldihydropteridine diphosphokinase [Bryobacteraceae bacterium]|nr:2-amino-4-hydroxy-6-hydroxymethyldihydropteridine diphosphokinase [Bryobacteraceae bacterium]